jgi:2-polyprenyl-3-methyl-5-hydroxy-6-metoxy-1,4-benzoquinol methylase
MDKPIQVSEYSTFNPVVLEQKGRMRQARQILNVLKIYLRGKNLKELRVLDVGSSSGIITNHLSNYFGKVYGIDVDKKSIALARRQFKKRNLDFKVMDATKTKFANNSFDIVICNQVYECLDSPEKLMAEIYRVLKNGGVCFFGAINKYTFWDSQYHLPLLVFMPKSLADWFVRVTKRADSFINFYRSYWQLRKLCKKFKIIRYTPKIINNPAKYDFRKLTRFQGVFRLFPVSFWEKVEPILPNFIWLLEK